MNDEAIKTKFCVVSGADAIDSDYETPEDDDPNNFMDLIFGVQSKLLYEVFLEQVSTKGTWIFNPVELREIVWKIADKPLLHLASVADKYKG